MLNIERYKDEIIDSYIINNNSFACGLWKFYSQEKDCDLHCHACIKRSLDWLCKEYKEPILDDIEKEYLSAVIKPFRNKVKCITKQKHHDEEYIVVCFEKTCMNFPTFPKGQMYKGMELLRFYSLEELGL